MITFDLTLNATWQEVLNGGDFIAFDVLSSSEVQIFFSESAATPSGDGNKVMTYPSSWDFTAAGMAAGAQRIWVKGSGSIRGVR